MVATRTTAVPQSKKHEEMIQNGELQFSGWQTPSGLRIYRRYTVFRRSELCRSIDFYLIIFSIETAQNWNVRSSVAFQIFIWRISFLSQYWHTIK